MDTKEIKKTIDLPDTGTRKIGVVVIFIGLTLSAFALSLFVLNIPDTLSAVSVMQHKIDMLLEIYDKWWVAAGILFGIWCGSENWKKQTWAGLNK